MNIAGTTALVTGATGGLGQAIARSLHAEGATLVLTGRRTGVLEPLTRELSATSVACDLADRDAVAGLAEDMKDVDIVVANAGLPGPGSYEDSTIGEIDTVLDVNLRAPIVLAQTIGSHMARRGRGHIVFISSLSGLVASPNNAMYNATKFGLRGYSLAARFDFAPAGVGVSVVLPGFIRDAGMFADAGVALPRGARTKAPEDVGQAVVDAIVHDRAEVLVAPFEMRLGAKLGAVAPSISALAQGTASARRASASLAHAQKGKVAPPG